MSDLPLTGGCGCGAVRFELTERPLEAYYCHCTRCQRRTGGAASAQARIVPGSLRWLRGEEIVQYWFPPGGYGKGFCRECGSHVCSRPPGDPTIFGVRLGAFDADPGVRPSFRQHVATAAAWEPIPDDGLPRYDELAPSM